MSKFWANLGIDAAIQGGASYPILEDRDVYGVVKYRQAVLIFNHFIYFSVFRYLHQFHDKTRILMFT
jgi:hypothetical protein